MLRSIGSQNFLNIDEHPSPREHGERSETVKENNLHGADQIKLEIGDARDELDQDNRGNGAKDDAGRACRPRGDREEDRIGDENGKREAQGERDRI